MNNNTVDVAIIGGGIHGAGVAQACAASGFSTTIIEQSEWGSGTSSKSSKLIHGGLRYLESADIQLVWQSLKERKTLLKIAPDLVKPLQFSIPVYQQTQRRPWKLWLGLSLYAVLAGLTPLARFRRSYSKHPMLNPLSYQMTFDYWDAQTNDQLLTQAVIQSAQTLGANTFSSTRFIAARQHPNGYHLTLEKNGQQQQLDCQFLVNSAGPWVNQVMTGIQPLPTPHAMDLYKGSHLILNQQISDQAFYMEAPKDRRAVFLLPWHGHSLLGTTEVFYEGDPSQVSVSAAEIDYLLDTVTHYFPDFSTDIVDQFAGLRVLPSAEGSAFSRSREVILHQSKQHPRLLSLYGGKLTTYRHTAAQTANHIAQVLSPGKPIVDTSDIILSSTT